MPNDVRDFTGYALYDQRTIYDELNARGKTWRIYFHDTPQTLALARQWQSQNKLNYSHIEHFEADAAGPAADLPAFVFVEPQYARTPSFRDATNRGNSDALGRARGSGQIDVCSWRSSWSTTRRGTAIDIEVTVKRGILCEVESAISHR